MNYKKINDLLRRENISIPKLAERVGMSKRGLYASIRNETLSVSTLERIAEALNVSITEFLDEKSGLSQNDTPSDASSQIRDLLKTKEDIIARLRKENEMLSKLLESSEDRLKKRIESNNFLVNLFETADEQLKTDPNFNASAFLFKFAQTLLEKGEINGLDLVYKLMDDSSITRLIDKTLRKTPPSF